MTDKWAIWCLEREEEENKLSVGCVSGDCEAFWLSFHQTTSVHFKFQDVGSPSGLSHKSSGFLFCFLAHKMYS